MDRTQLKYLAVIAMIVDHIGVFLLSAHAPGNAAGSIAAAGTAAGALTALYVICRVFGRLTAPIMCFFLAEGFAKTSSRKKYVLRLLVFALISQVPYALAHHGVGVLKAWSAGGSAGAAFSAALRTPDFNMIATLLIAFLAAAVFQEVRDSRLRWFLIIVLILASIPCDWGVFAPLFVLCFYIFRRDRRKQLLSFSIITAILIALNIGYLVSKGTPWYAELWQLGMFLFLPVIRLYNGEPGGGKTAVSPEDSGSDSAALTPAHAFFGKWFFYIIYPAHLLVFFLLRGLTGL